MGKIVRRTNAQIVRDTIRELVVEPQEINLISLKNVFSKVKNIDQFKQVVDILMDIVTSCIIDIEEGLLNPRQHYQSVVKSRLIASLIKDKSKLTLTGLSKRYRNEMKDFLVEDGNYFLNIKDKELKKLKDEADLFYDDNDLKEHLLRVERFKLFLALLPNSSIAKKEASTSIERLWRDSIKVQLKRGRNVFLKPYLNGIFVLDRWEETRPFEMLDTDLQVKLFKSFSFSLADGKVLFDSVNVKRLTSVDLVVDVDNKEFLAREQKLIEQKELSNEMFLLERLNLEEEFVK